MAGIAGQITTHNGANYEGPIYDITPEDTPLLSAIGGGGMGGDRVNSTVFSWQEHDLRAVSQTGALEGAAAPAGTGRARTNVFNVLQIIHELTEVSDTKQATNRMVKAMGSAHPHAGSAGQGNPVTSELDWQTVQMLKQIARDMEHTLINGVFQEPADNATVRKTRGLLAAIVTNAVSGASLTQNVTGPAATDLVTSTAHGFVLNDKVQFTAIGTGGAGAGFAVGVTYYAVTISANTFQLAATASGAPILWTTDFAGTWTIQKVSDVTVDLITSLMQMVWDNGGIRETEKAVLIANSYGLIKLNSAFLAATGAGFRQDDRTVGGTNLQTVFTPFGKLGVMLNRYIPQNTIAVASLEELRVKWLENEFGATLYGEKLARAGLSQRVQFSGEWGLEYGNERSHGELTGLSTR